MQPYPGVRTDEKSFPGLWRGGVDCPRLRAEPFYTLEDFDRCLAEKAIELCYKWADANVGILNLTTVDDESMWAYYANNNCGVQVHFNVTHPFFTATIRPVTHSDLPIYISMNNGTIRLAGRRLSKNVILDQEIDDVPLDLLMRKRTAWQHEREWRPAAIGRAGFEWPVSRSRQNHLPCPVRKLTS